MQKEVGPPHFRGPISETVASAVVLFQVLFFSRTDLKTSERSDLKAKEVGP